MKATLTQLIHDLVGQCRTPCRREMLINECMSMVYPAVQEFGNISTEVLERVKSMIEKYQNARKTVNGDEVGILTV